MRLNSLAARTAFRAVQREFGEVVQIEPLIQGELSVDLTDPSRKIVKVYAIIALTPKTDILDGSRQGSKINTTTRFTQRDAAIWLRPEVYAAISYELREGDRVRMIGRPSEPPYKVSRAPASSDRGDIIVSLVLDGNR